jgi:hypothetical protein
MQLTLEGMRGALPAFMLVYEDWSGSSTKRERHNGMKLATQVRGRPSTEASCRIARSLARRAGRNPRLALTSTIAEE